MTTFTTRRLLAGRTTQRNFTLAAFSDIEPRRQSTRVWVELCVCSIGLSFCSLLFHFLLIRINLKFWILVVILVCVGRWALALHRRLLDDQCLATNCDVEILIIFVEERFCAHDHSLHWHSHNVIVLVEAPKRFDHRNLRWFIYFETFCSFHINHTGLVLSSQRFQRGKPQRSRLIPARVTHAHRARVIVSPEPEIQYLGKMEFREVNEMWPTDVQEEKCLSLAQGRVSPRISCNWTELQTKRKTQQNQSTVSTGAM